jgi:hypothetical protein
MVANDDYSSSHEDVRRALLQRILRSRHFEKSSRTKEFLAYICEQALDGRSSDVHEQDIGAAVFGRPPDYDTSQDNIVRVNATQIRKKLDAYFHSEGASEPIIIEIPKGQYAPVFRERIAPSEGGEAAGGPTGRRGIHLAILCLAGLSPLLMIGCVWLALSARAQRASATGSQEDSPALNALWLQMFRKGEETGIVVADSSFGLLQELTEKPTTLSDYLHPDLWRQAPDLASRPEVQSTARLIAQRRYTSMADLNLSQRVLSLAGRYQGRVALYFARDLNIHQMKTGNLILFGGKRVNPWIELVENQMNFRSASDASSHQPYFENTQPRSGEMKTYRNDPRVGYCRIAFLPNLSKTGNLVVISGTEMEATEAGGEFLTNEAWLSVLRKRVPTDGSGRFPHFEILLRANKVGGAAPAFEIVATKPTP